MSTRQKIDAETINLAARTLLKAAPAGSVVILFGSQARGDVTARSDMDFLVVEPEVVSRADEMTRLTRALLHLRIAADVLVVSVEQFDYWKDTPNTVFYRAAREGKRYEQVA